MQRFGRARTRLADRLVAEALDVLRDAGPMPPDAVRLALLILVDSELAPDVVDMAMRQLHRDPDVVVGGGLLAHRAATNGSRVYA